jgi:hypothetical protein
MNYIIGKFFYMTFLLSLFEGANTTHGCIQEIFSEDFYFNNGFLQLQESYKLFD